MSGMSGLKYEALKDFIEWATPDNYSTKFTQKRYIPLLLSLGSKYVSLLNEKK